MTTTHTRLLARGLLAAASLAAAGPAFAQGVPDNRFSTCDPVVVGNPSGTAIGGVPAGFDVGVRDVNNAPMPGSIVTLDFSATTIRISSLQASGTTVDCAARTLSRVTNAAGNVNFAPRLGGWENTNAIVVLIKNGTEHFTVKGRSTDLDGDGRTQLGDLLYFSANFLAQPSAQETDFDLNGSTALGDYLIFAAEFLGNATNPYCP